MSAEQVSGVAEGMPRPTAVGYAAIPIGTPWAGEIALRQDLLAFAAGHGYTLRGIFTERQGAPGLPELANLIEALENSDVRTVIVPSVEHLGRLSGVRTAVRRWLERETGATVITMHGGLENTGPPPESASLRAIGASR